jgi:hypothetical protein
MKYLFLLLFVAIFCTSCTLNSNDLNPTSIVEPPERHTPVEPINYSESELISQTIQAFLTGDREFWTEVSTAAYPFLHQRYETEEDFIGEMIKYSEYYALRCENVLKYSSVPLSNWSGFEVTNVVFSGTPIAEEDEFDRSMFTNSVSIIEVFFVSRGNDSSNYFLGDVGYQVPEGETVQEKVEAFIEMKRTTLTKYDEELVIDACP